MRTIKKKLVVVTSAVLVIVLLIVPKKKTTDVDIMTGQTRKTWSVGSITIRGKTEESPFSKMFTPEEINAVTPKWKPVFSDVWSGLICWRGHPTYHGAISQMYTWKLLWDVAEQVDRFFPDGVPENLTRKTAKDILTLWQAGGNDGLASNYVWCLQDMMWNREENVIAQLEALMELAIIQTTTNGNETSTAFFYPNGRPMQYERNNPDTQSKTIFTWEWDGKSSEIIISENGNRSSWWRDTLPESPLYDEAVRLGAELTVP
jgi:hypothetical protein